MIMHIVNCHADEFLDYTIDELITMYRSNSASTLTVTLFGQTISALIMTAGLRPEDLQITDEQITRLVDTVIATPNPWISKGPTHIIAMIALSVMTIKTRLPEIYDRYMTWIKENIEHIKPFKRQFEGSPNVFDGKADPARCESFKNELNEFLPLLE